MLSAVAQYKPWYNIIHAFTTTYREADLTLSVSIVLSMQSTPTEHIEIGQLCLKCGQKCPGYMQHIWRYTAVYE